MEKIESKHRLNPLVAKEVLSGAPYIEKVGGNQYMAIGLSYEGYVTIFFKYCSGTAEIITAYPSTEWQVDLYRGKKKR
ncbi:MAG: hypothetical protein CHKLHMKO_00222 [Candidatus Argoarchaeum ethanivorans]|uniref:DUF4258 domain-containing protein n=1 Tax=Candidatus Argoarchaeum ethanivorans TaxID=2608793 RepID=A0A811T6V9_9EURY|nr:MAG: hypothetical protein CHKLHMKO_00222 [Candidatus Argoarchaeum ethanivorans]